MAIKALLFDLGGVVIDIDFECIFKKWSFYTGIPVSEIQSAFEMDEFYQQHERGEIDGFDYHRHISKSLDLNLSYDQFCDGWNDIFVSTFAPTINILKQLQGVLPLYALSNSNNLHLKYFQHRYFAELSYFNHIYVSSDIGFRKPEPEAFLEVARSIGIDISEIVFFDDLAENVEAASALGLKSVLVKSPEDIAFFVDSNILFPD